MIFVVVELKCSGSPPGPGSQLVSFTFHPHKPFPLMHPPADLTPTIHSSRRFSYLDERPSASWGGLGCTELKHLSSDNILIQRNISYSLRKLLEMNSTQFDIPYTAYNLSPISSKKTEWCYTQVFRKADSFSWILSWPLSVLGGIFHTNTVLGFCSKRTFRWRLWQIHSWETRLTRRVWERSWVLSWLQY
jgi:hypothetical protein